MVAVASPVRAAWSPAERAAWRPLPRLKPSEWAARYRVLPRAQTARPGPWMNEYAPYLRTMMDLCTAPGVVQLNICKGAQEGVSEAMRNVQGYWADMDPDPVGLTLPNRPKGREIVENRIIPMLRDTPRLRRLLTARSHDVKKEQIRLANGFILHLMWSGSPAAMASDPMRRVINDEVDKHDEWAGREAGSVALTAQRLETYGARRLQANLSTPTTRNGQIWRLFEASDWKLYYFVPCPHCGAYQRLVFPNLKYPKFNVDDRFIKARKVLDSNAVAYECSECHRKIAERLKGEMVRQGRWCAEQGYVVDAAGIRYEDAAQVPQWPPETRIGMQISNLYCLWRRWATIAAEWIRAEGDINAQFSFRTNTLGEPYERIVDRPRVSFFADRSSASSLPEGIVPRWGAMLLATIDTQKDHFWVVIRAWGHQMRSARIWHGRVETWADLERLCFQQPWPVEKLPGEDEKTRPAAMMPAAVFIDSGGTRHEGEPVSRTVEVYAWTVRWRGHVRAMKGEGRGHQGLQIWRGEGWMRAGDQQSKGTKLTLWHFDEEWFEDALQELIYAKIGEGEEGEAKWLLNQRNDEEYNRHLAGKHKVLLREGLRHVERWIPVQSGGRYDLRDCEKMQIAGAYMMRVNFLPPEKELEKYRQALRKAASGVKRTEDEPASERWVPKRFEV